MRSSEAVAGRVGAIVVGAGSGRRLGSIEKAFLPVAGQPLIAHSLAVFDACDEIDEICVVVSAGSVSRTRELVQTAGLRKVTSVVPGGKERQDSVRAGLESLRQCAYVAVHDAARPLVDATLVRKVVAQARRSGAALAGTLVRDTLKRAADGVAHVNEEDTGYVVARVAQTLDRRSLWAAQTPQVFRTELLARAFAAAGDRAAAFTDDASLVEAIGHAVHVVEGGAVNVKLTYPEDVPVIEALLRARGEGKL